MPLRIETFSNVKGGNSYFKALTHPGAAPAAAALLRRLEAARSVAIIDPQGFADGFAAVFDLSGVSVAGLYVQAIGDIGRERLGSVARPLTDLPVCGADLVFVAAFDAEKPLAQIAALVPAGAGIATLDDMRLPDSLLTNRARYLDPLNFATNFALFRDRDGHHTRLVTANYWSGYGAAAPSLACTLFDGDGRIVASWQESLGPAQAAVAIDSRSVRARFGLAPFEGQLFLHVIGAAGHDVVKYALDTWSDDGSLSATHDANAWPADYYAGLPAPAVDETVTLWIQNSLPVTIPPGGITLGIMGKARTVAFDRAVTPFASVALDTRELLPDARWPAQIEITAGRYVVRPRYEIERGTRRRIAHPNVERTDLQPDPVIATMGRHLGKGFILPAPVLPTESWRTLVLPTPMARSQEVLPIAATVYDPAGREVVRHGFGRLPRDHATALDVTEIAGPLPWGHVELAYDFTLGTEADGWLHALFRFEHHATGHAAETSFGAHVFNTIMTWRDEPQSYSGRPPGLSTRLFLRLGDSDFDTLCHLIYPASLPWHPESATDLILLDGAGSEVVRESVRIACGGSLAWRYHEMFDVAARKRAGSGASIVVRDTTCRLFGYHGLIAEDGRFSLDHMFGF